MRKKFVNFILRLRRNPSFSYWVCAESHLNYTEFTWWKFMFYWSDKNHFSHISFSQENLHREDKGELSWTFLKRMVYLILKFNSVCPYTEYTQNKPSSHPMDPIEKMFRPAYGPRIFNLEQDIEKFMTSEISCQCTFNPFFFNKRN